MKKILTLIIAGLLIGCDTMPIADQYRPSATNSVSIQRADGTTKIGTVTSDLGVSVERFCRGVGNVSVDPNKNLIEYIENALLEELFSARAYDDQSTSQLSLTVNELTHNTLTGANWTIGLTASSSSTDVVIKTRTIYPFKTSFSGLTACKNLSDSYAGAVSTSLQSIFSDPNFYKLLNKN